MNKKLLGFKAKGSYYESIGNLEKAIEQYLKCTELPEVWRAIALLYSDLDDLENSLSSFEKSVDSGDLKSVPWLYELLQTHRPNDSRIPNLKSQIDLGLKNGTVDIVFSLGNLHLIAGEDEEAIKFWAPYINTEYWIINRNIANILLIKYEQLGNYIPNPHGPIDSEQKALDFFLHVNEKAFKDGLSQGLVELGYKFAEFPNLEKFKDYSATQFYDAFMEFAAAGDDQGILLAIYFANAFKDEIIDDTKLMALVKEYELEDFLEELNYRKSVEDQMSQMASKYGSNVVKSNTAIEIQSIFERAEAAQKAGDTIAEISAWVEGVELGDENCFHNLGVVLCNELGIVQNFFGAQGGDDKAWSAFAKGIGASENRPGRGSLHLMSRLLSSNQINLARSVYGQKQSGNLDHLNPAHESSLIKICDLFEKCGFVYSKLDQNLVALPFSSAHGNFLIFCELIEDDGRDLALIYSCLLTSPFNEEGMPESRISELRKIQKKAFEILIRDQELIFPSMAMDIGTIFNSIPTEKEPHSFINITKANEYWSVIGLSIPSIFYEVLPTKHEFDKIEFGYGVDIGLQSDHFETAIRGIAGAITGILNLLPSMQAESPELFDLIFGANPTSLFNFNSNLVEYKKLAELGSKTAKLITVFEESDQSKRLNTLLALSNEGMHVARRAMMEAVEVTPRNIDTIAQETFKELDLDDSHPQVRDILNNVGWKYGELNEIEKANNCYEKAAKLGSSNAMSNFSWGMLLSGNHRKAREVFDASYYRIMTTRETELDYEQSANCRSNDALHRFALGAPFDELREIWQDSHFQENHLESKFYPILLDHLEGDNQKVQKSLSNLSSAEKEELAETFRPLLNAHEWIAGISKKSLELLGEEPQKKKGLFRR